MPLYLDLLQSIQFNEERKSELKMAVENGASFFSRFNNSRMALAFSSFSEDMKKALFEVLFFLHVNDKRFSDHTYIKREIQKVDGKLKEVEVSTTINLFVEGAPTGVVGIENLSEIFRKEFEEFIDLELKAQIPPSDRKSAIYSISSLGSIGTVGHKKTASDLDLQVQYELGPFLYNPVEFTDKKLLGFSKQLMRFFAHRFQTKKKYKPKHLKHRKIHALVVRAGKVNYKNKFPILYDVLVRGDREVREQVFNSIEKRQACVQELIDMINLYLKVFEYKKLKESEKLLKKRIAAVQKYVQEKYPDAEVYLFDYSNDDYRKGLHGTTLESKEASGSAYELILNYEVLMPGIQFTPMIPVHFLMPESVNSNQEEYERLVKYIRFHFISLYDTYRRHLVDLGATPPLTAEYMTAHSGAIYWESFKASSGNLPKALLNLFRIEMLFNERFNTSIIELIKHPKKFDDLIEEAKTDHSGPQDINDSHHIFDDDYDDDDDDDDDFFDDFGEDDDEDYEGKGAEEQEHDVIGAEEREGGIPIRDILKIEDQFPELLMDPWWLRYKALKIGMGPENKRITNKKERELISRVIDLGFALHIRISDVFVKPGEKAKFNTHREHVMEVFLKKAFPESKRRHLEHIFYGDVDAVNQFESDLKTLFQNSMNRVNQIVSEQPGTDQSNQDEYRIWYHYYKTNFNPPANYVRRDILGHLKVPRGRLQIGFNGKKKIWFFKSLQKSRLNASRINTFGKLDHLPDEVELFEHPSFLHGIAHCILNDYYGITNKGTLFESRTHLEFSVAHMKLGKPSADQWAYIRPDNVTRMFDKIDHFFVPQNYDYRDCIYKDREVTEIFICINLLEYGRLSFLYRDNMKVWCVDNVDHPKIEKMAFECYNNPELIFNNKLLINSIGVFFEKQNFSLTRKNRSKVAYWFNPNSIKSGQSASKMDLKEQQLSKEFDDAVYKELGR